MTVTEKFEALRNRDKLTRTLRERLDELQSLLDNGDIRSANSCRLEFTVPGGSGIEDGIATVLDAIDETQAQLVELEAICAACRKAIDCIPYQQSKEVLRLRFDQNMTVSQMANHLETSTNTVRRRIKTALSIAENPKYWHK